jgi:hypothetical protein
MKNSKLFFRSVVPLVLPRLAKGERALEAVFQSSQTHFIIAEGKRKEKKRNGELSFSCPCDGRGA